MAYMIISGKERALVGEKIILNITLLKSGISKIIISLSPSLKLIKSFNYNLDKKYFSKKIIPFEINDFSFENILTLGFLSEKPEQEEDIASIEIKALDIEENLKEMSVFDIEILKPEIKIDIESLRDPGKLNIRLEKINNEITTFFKELKVSAIDYITKRKVKTDIIKFTEEEYIENLDDIPIIFDIDTAIKEIIIHSAYKIKLNIQARYSDLLNNEYKSNKAKIILEPVPEKLREEEFITTPIFNTIGFESPEIATISS